MGKKGDTCFNNIIYIFKNVKTWDKSLIIYFLMYALFFAIEPIIELFFTKFVVNEISRGIEFSYIINCIFMFAIISLIFSTGKEYLFSHYDAKVTFIRFQFLARFYKRCMRIEYAEIEKPTTLDYMEMCCSFVGSSNRGLALFINRIVDITVEFGTAIICLCFLGKLNNWIIVLFALTAFIEYHFQLKQFRYRSSYEEEKNNLQRKISYTRECFSRASSEKDIRLFKMQKFLFHIQNKNIKKYVSLIERICKRFQKVSIVNGLVVCARHAIVFVFLIILYNENKIMLGDFSFFVMVLLRIAIILNLLTNNLAEIKGENYIMNLFREFVELPEINNETKEDVNEINNYNFEISFENVSFHYPGSNENILEEISFTIHGGEKLAIVGINGSGKSTLIKLLCRLYQPSKGRILINGKDIQGIPLEQYFKMLSVVFQDPNVMEFTIAENIGMTMENKVDKDLLYKVMEENELLDKVNSLECKESTFIGKNLSDAGIALSGGEQQKIAVARADYKDGGLFIFDEPTASMDPIAEKNVYERYLKIYKNKTMILISHRMSSIKLCSRILVLSDRKIKEIGTHEQLMAQNGEYARLYNIQEKYYV